MHPSLRMRQYQRQAIVSASPDQLIAKLYDIAVAACRREDRAKLRAVLVELIASLNFEKGGEVAQRLHALYEYCLLECGSGDLTAIAELLDGLRTAWKQGVLHRKAA